MSFLNKYIKIYWRRFIIALVFLTIEALCDLLQPTIMSRIVDYGVAGKDMPYVLGMGGVMLSHVFNMFIRAKASAERIEEVFSKENTMKINEHSLGKNDIKGRIDFENVTFAYDGNDNEPVLRNISFTCFPGETIGIIGSTALGKSTLVNLIPRFYDVSSGSIKVDGIDVKDMDIKYLRQIVGAFAMMMILSPVLTLASIITIPLVFLMTRNVAKRTSLLFKEQQAVLGKLNGHIEENISGILVVKAFNREDKVIEEFDYINSSLCNVGIKAQIWSGYIIPLMNVINNIGFSVVAAVGGVLAVKDIITIGVIASFLSYSRQFARPLNDIANIFNTLQSAVAGAERVFDTMDEKEERMDEEGAEALADMRGEVKFKNVSFEYKTGVPVLKDISFAIKPGSTIAFNNDIG